MRAAARYHRVPRPARSDPCSSRPKPTPNPATLKFLPGRAVLENGTLDMRDEAEAAQSPLAERLFAVPGVSGVFFGGDFITVTKTRRRMAAAEARRSSAPSWSISCRARRSCRTGEERAADDEFFDASDAETVATIKDLIETRVRPAVANDGGDITFRGFKDGIVYLEHEGLMLGLPVLDRDAQARHPEPAPAFRARRGGSAAGLIPRPSAPP